MQPDDPKVRQILAVIRSIPPGVVTSYGQIAERAGLPRRARLVGQVLRSVDADPPLPWHRVLRSDGRIAFPLDSEPFKRQVNLLQAENVVVLGGRVDLDRFGWEMDVDRLLWGPED